MDGSSDIFSGPIAAQRRAFTGDAGDVGTPRKVLNYCIAAAQIAVVARVLADFDSENSIRITNFSVLLICGFATATIFWANSPKGAGLRENFGEIARRTLHVAAL